MKRISHRLFENSIDRPEVILGGWKDYTIQEEVPHQATASSLSLAFSLSLSLSLSPSLIVSFCTPPPPPPLSNFFSLTISIHQQTVWQTKKLLSSFDAVAISAPPEEDSNNFATPGSTWLHLDQAAKRQGLHCYQGAVYLEEASDTDYCFR